MSRFVDVEIVDKFTGEPKYKETINTDMVWKLIPALNIVDCTYIVRIDKEDVGRWKEMCIKGNVEEIKERFNQ